MNPTDTSNWPQMGPRYFPYFYASGRFLVYDRPLPAASLEVRDRVGTGYDFTSDLVPRKQGPYRGQTVDDVIRRGYLSVPQSEPEIAIISDKKDTARLGLDDVIGQIRNRYRLYDNNFAELEQAKCSAINCLYSHEAYHGPTNSKVEYSVQKRLNDLYEEQRLERVNLWRDVSRLRLGLPENAQQYLTAYRKVSILEDNKGDGR